MCAYVCVRCNNNLVITLDFEGKVQYGIGVWVEHKDLAWDCFLCGLKVI